MTTVTAAVLAIISTPPLADAKPDERYIVSTRRSTKQNPVPEGERYRAVIQHASILAVPSAECASRFYNLLQSSIDALAAAKLAAFVKENPTAKEVQSDAFTMAGILAYANEQAASLAIDAVKVADWFKASATHKHLPEAVAASWLAKLPKIASPNYRGAGVFNGQSCASIVAKLHEDDLEHPVAQFVMTRCNTIITEASADAF